MSRYMVVERFSPNDMEAIYARFAEKGRMLPDGLVFTDSWLTVDNSTVFQLMETTAPILFDIWTEKWSDLVQFEIIPLRDKPSPE